MIQLQSILTSMAEQGLLFAFLGLGVLITFRFFRFPDLTAEGSYPLGGAVAASLLVAGVNPFVATAAASVPDRTARTAATGSSRPNSIVPNVDVTGADVPASVTSTWPGVSVGSAERSSAAVPAAKGAAMELPLQEAYPVPVNGWALVMASPGAARRTLVPVVA